jgi:hypothetical protein
VSDRRTLPLGPLPVLLPGLAIVVVVVGSTLAQMSWPYQEWIRTSAEFHQQNALAAPIAAAAATYYAGRLTPPDRIFALPSAVRTGAPMVRRHLLVLITAFVTSYLIGLAPLVITTVRDAEHGGPHLLVMLTGLLGIAMATSLGYVIGVLGRTALLAPLSFILLFALTMLGTSGDDFAALAPVLHVEPILGQVEAAPLVAYRIAFLLVAIVTAAAASAALLRAGRSRTARLRALAALIAPILLVVPALIRTPALFSLETSAHRICAVQRDVEYCVHAGHRSQLTALVAAADPIIASYPARVPRIDRIYDVALSGSVGDDPRTVWFMIEPRNPTGTDAVNVPAVLSGLDTCLRKYGPEPTGAAAEATELAQNLNVWLLHKGDPPAGSGFHGVPVEKMRGWISRVQNDIAACTLSKGDLPR